MTQTRANTRLTLAALAVAAFVAGCTDGAGRVGAINTGMPDDDTPTNRTSSPTPTADTVPGGGGGGAGTGDDIGSGVGQ
jgi:hypothetical protein